MSEGIVPSDAGTSTDVLSRASPALCALRAYTLGMTDAGEKKPAEYIPLSPPLLAIEIPFFQKIILQP